MLWWRDTPCLLSQDQSVSLGSDTLATQTSERGLGDPQTCTAGGPYCFSCSTWPDFGPCQPALHESVQLLSVGQHAPGTIASGTYGQACPTCLHPLPAFLHGSQEALLLHHTHLHEGHKYCSTASFFQRFRLQTSRSVQNNDYAWRSPVIQCWYG